MSKHTEKPWRYAGTGPTGHSIKTAEHEGFSIVPNIAMPIEEVIANAKLIATAPELLEALEPVIGTHGIRVIHAEEAARLRALIAKAKGK